MAYARVSDDRIIEICPHAVPEGFYHPDVAAQFLLVPDWVGLNWVLDGGVWVAPPIPPHPPEPEPVPVIIPPLSIGEFLLLFTASERVGIKASANPIVQDWFDIVTKYLTQINLHDAGTGKVLDYLVSLGLLDAARKASILAGVRP